MSLPAAMNVIRMIKLFGWEPKVAAQLSEKREEELELIKKNKLLDLVNNNLKYVVCANVLYRTLTSTQPCHSFDNNDHHLRDLRTTMCYFDMCSVLTRGFRP